MNIRTRNIIKVIPFFVILMAFAIAGTGAKSAAEWPPSSCREAAMSRDSILATQVRAEVSAVRQEAVLPGYQLRRPE
jgi:hypothetical protein